MVDLERQYRVMFETMAQGAYFCDVQGRPTDVNPAALEMLGLTREQFLGPEPLDSWGTLIGKDGAEIPFQQFPVLLALQEGQPVRDFLIGFQHFQQSSPVWLSVNAVPIASEDDTRPHQVFVTLHDLTQPKRLNEVHAARLHLMQFAVTHSLEELLVETLDKLEELTASRIGFYHFYDEDQRSIFLQAWSTATTATHCHLQSETGHYHLDRAGIWADCIRLRKPVIHNDFQSLPRSSEFPPQHAPVIRELVVPVQRHGRIVATLGVGNKPVEYTSADVETVTLFADLVWDIAARKLDEQALRSSEALTRAVFEGSLNALFLITEEGKIQSSNPAAVKLLQWNNDELCQMSYGDLFVMEQPSERALIERLISENFTALELQAIRKDGETLPVEIDTIAMNGRVRPVCSLLVLRDTSERKRAEQKLQVYKNITSATEDFIALVDCDYVYRIVNDSYLRLYGKRRNEIVGRKVEETVGEDIFTEHIKARLDNCLQGQKIRCQQWFNHSDGNRRFMDISYTPYIEHGEIKGATVVGRDITEVKQAEESLQQTRSVLQAAMDQSPAGVAIVDAPDGKLRYVNDAGLMIRGIGRAELETEMTIEQYVTCWRLFELDGQPLRTDDFPLARAIRLGETCNRELLLRHPRGNDHFVSANAAPIKNDSGEVQAAIVVFTDITEQKKAEEERNQLEKQLQQTLKIESIGQLAGGVAHDFNNMLGVIMGHAEMALNKADISAALIGDLEQIRLAAKRSADLTRQLLTFARKQTIVPMVLDLNETVSGMLKMLQRLIGENIQLSWNPAAELWPVKVDPSQVDQILANLCVNSRDAIQDGGEIAISTGNYSFDETFCSSRPYAVEPGDYVLLSVSDDGCGMSREVQAHIFEPFFTTKEIGAGTGLGLATVYGAVKQNKGFISIDSEPGAGTVFNVYFPRETTLARQPADESPILQYSGTETILLVEDDEMLLQMEATMLEDCGYRVLTAALPSKALELAQEFSEPIHLLISDMIMPVMNGRELSLKLKALRPELKVIFLSGYTADIISKQSVLAEGVYFIQKPVPLERLTSTVRSVLDGP